MKKSFVALAVTASCISIIVALDPGRFAFAKVDAGGHPLRMLISGHGSPTVLFETGGTAGGGGPLECWERVQPAVSKFTRTVSYDRAGSGLSPAGPKPRDARQVAQELHAALKNADVAPPYILVGHSFGGPLNRVFAGMYPNEVAGMVLLDPTQEEFIFWNRARETNRTERLNEEWKEICASLNQAHESRVPAGVPVVLITGMRPPTLPGEVTQKEREEINVLRPMWLKFHNEWVEKIPNAQHIVTTNSGHAILFEEPELVIKTIREMVNRGRR